MRTTRRQIIAYGAAAFAFAGAGAPRLSQAQSLVPAKLRLNWLLGGAQAPFRLGEERGYFKGAGIDIEILEGRGAGVTARAVGAQSELFGLADASAVIAAISKGVPIRSIMAIEGVANWAIIARADRGISTPADLKGKTVAMTAGDAPSGVFPVVLEANNVKSDDVRRAIMDPGGKKAAVMAGTVDAFLGHASDALHILDKGVEVKVLRYADFGAVQVGTTLITHVDTIRNSPELVRKFVKASQRSWRDAIADPKETVAVVAKTLKRQSNEKTMLGELNNAIAARSKNVGDKPFGYISPKDWSDTVQIAKAHLGLKPTMADAEMYTNEFVAADKA